MGFVKKDGLKETTDEDMHEVVKATEVKEGEDVVLIIRQAVAKSQAEQHAWALGYED